jgi:flagellin
MTLIASRHHPAKSQILQQASTAMLAQANASKQGVLQLLQG